MNSDRSGALSGVALTLDRHSLGCGVLIDLWRCLEHQRHLPNGIEFDALNWNLEPLVSRLAEVYDLIELKGRVHAFIK